MILILKGFLAAQPPRLEASSSITSAPSPPSETPFGAPYEPSSFVKKQRQVNMTKFEEPSSPRCPEGSPFWIKALASVNPTWQAVYTHRNQSLLRGYAFLDPYILCSDGARTNTYFLAWLIFRSTCLSFTLEAGLQVFSKIDKRELAKPSTQDWRDFLFESSMDSCRLVST